MEEEAGDDEHYKDVESDIAQNQELFHQNQGDLFIKYLLTVPVLDKLHPECEHFVTISCF